MSLGISRCERNARPSWKLRGAIRDRTTKVCASVLGMPSVCSAVVVKLTARVAKSSTVAPRISSRRIRRSKRKLAVDTWPGAWGRLLRWMPSGATWKLW